VRPRNFGVSKVLEVACLLFLLMSLIGCAGLSAFSPKNGSTTQPATLSITGTISPTAGGSAATVTLTGAATVTTNTDNFGNYTFAGLPAGSYTVTPSKSAFHFNPATKATTLGASNVTGMNFTAAAGSPPTTYSILGNIGPAGSGAGALVVLGGAASASTNADGNGNYSFSGLSSGSYTVTASESGFIFSPSTLNETITNANITGVNFTATAPTYSLSGTISPAANGSGATVTLGGAGSATATVNSSGAFSFRGLPAGIYTLTASKSGFTFSPSSQNATITNANVAGVAFTATANVAPTYSISGAISSAANGAGAVVTLNGSSSASTTANSSGGFSFSGLSNGSYTVTVIKTGFTFSPSTQSETINNGNVTGVNFTATALTYSISGTITPAANGSGAAVVLSGTSGGSTTADGNGNFSFSGLTVGPYTLTASKSGFTFSPSSQNETISSSNITGVSFSASALTYSISGTISPAASGSGATVVLSGTSGATTTANSSGAFTFTGLGNGSYMVTASKSGYTFSPSTQSETISNASLVGVNFSGAAATYSLSGTISPAANGAGATVVLSGTSGATTTANSSGAFSFSGLSNGSYTVTASKSGFTLNPASQAETVAAANVSGVNFTATAAAQSTYSITGTITPATNGSGATITLSGSGSATTTADSSGNYSFSGLSGGAYTLTPSKSGFSFGPSSESATISTANVPGMNFTASPSVVGGVNIYPGDNIPSIVAANPQGTTFIINPGTYRLAQSIVPKNGDTFIGQTECAPPASSCPAILSGSIVIGPQATFNGTYYQVTGQTQQGTQGASGICDPGWSGCVYPEDLFFDGTPYQHLYATSMPLIGPGQWWFDYANHTIYFHDNPAGHTVETSVLNTAFGGTANNVTIQYLTVEEFANMYPNGAVGVFQDTTPQSTGTNWVVENCEVRLNHGAGVRVGYDIQILNNYIHNNGQLGVSGGIGVTTAPATASLNANILIQGNTITYNDFAHFLPDFGSGGVKVGSTNGVTLRGNTIQHNEGSGMHFDDQSENSLVDGNIITDNSDGDGLGKEVSEGTSTFRNNVVARNGANLNGANYTMQIGVHSSTGVNAYCNTIEISSGSNIQGWGVIASNRGDSAFPPFQYLVTTGNSFHHNTVIWDAGSGGVVGYVQGDASNEPNFFANNTPPDYNTYHVDGSPAEYFIYDNNNSQVNNVRTFASYQANGADVHGSVDTNNSSGYPTVAISSPADQSQVSGASTIVASATDASGISKVEFYVDWALQATVTGAPYSYNWTNGTTGTHTVTAMAYSNAGIRSCYAVTLNQQ
jgi:parallel beta-helix repeat protein